MPANPVQINLLGGSDLEHTPVGRIISWATTYGRYIMIGTEIVVLLAFISRFSLDRKLTDLNDEITQKQAIITVNQNIESRINSVNSQIAKIKALYKDQDEPLRVLDAFQTLLPPDVYLVSIDVTAIDLKVGAVAGTTTGFSQMINLISSNRTFTGVELGQVTKSITGINFQINAKIAIPTPTRAPRK